MLLPLTRVRLRQAALSCSLAWVLNSGGNPHPPWRLNTAAGVIDTQAGGDTIGADDDIGICSEIEDGGVFSEDFDDKSEIGDDGFDNGSEVEDSGDFSEDSDEKSEVGGDGFDNGSDVEDGGKGRRLRTAEASPVITFITSV